LNALILVSRNVQQGQAPRTVQVIGGSLATVAAKYYGDVSLTMQLAQANGLSTAQLPSGVFKTIILPPFPMVA
jgi:cytochrome c551/c552